MLNLADIIEPMPGRVAVLVNVKDEITPAGLYIPETTARTIHEAKPTQGTVVAIGSDDDLEEPPLTFKIGDVVLFGKYSGTEIRYTPDKSKTAEKIVILTFKDIIARFKLPEEVENVKVRG